MLQKIKSVFFHDYWIPRFFPTLLVFYPVAGIIVSLIAYLNDASRFGLIQDAVWFALGCYALVALAVIIAFFVEWVAFSRKSIKEFLIYLWRM